MEILVCIDDTDNIESRGTGELAAIMSYEIESRKWGRCRSVTRHQMLVHPDIPYTSHNSSMCFPADITPDFLGDLTEFAQSFLKIESASGSDPGLCIVKKEELRDHNALMEFGKRAKKEVIQKDDAYTLAENLGVHLSEHGGTGLGIIGALAGCGLRMTGNDGRFRGHFKVDSENGSLTVSDLIQQTGVDLVQSLEGKVLSNDEIVRIGIKVKAVLLNGKSTLLVYDDSDNGSVPCWKTCSKEQLRVY